MKYPKIWLSIIGILPMSSIGQKFMPWPMEPGETWNFDVSSSSNVPPYLWYSSGTQIYELINVDSLSNVDSIKCQFDVIDRESGQGINLSKFSIDTSYTSVIYFPKVGKPKPFFSRGIPWLFTQPFNGLKMVPGSQNLFTRPGFPASNIYVKDSSNLSQDIIDSAWFLPGIGLVEYKYVNYGPGFSSLDKVSLNSFEIKPVPILNKKLNCKRTRNFKIKFREQLLGIKWIYLNQKP